MKKKTVKIINIILIVVFIIAAFNIGKIYYDYNKLDNLYNDIRDKYVSSNLQDTVSDETPDNKAEQYDTAKTPISIDFNALLSRNKDVIGWIYCPDTVVSYPVVQGKNNDHYLHKDLDGKYLAGGTLFADYRNGALGDDVNYIIYGHNMKNGSMFNLLTKYKEQSYYDQYPIMYYLTPDTNYKLELFAGLVIKRDDDIYLPTQNEKDFTKLIEEYRAKSTFKSDVTLKPNDIIVTLSTCSYEFDNARYIVMGRLVPV